MPFDYFSLGKHVIRHVVFSSLNVAVVFMIMRRAGQSQDQDQPSVDILVSGVWWERGERSKEMQGRVMESGARIWEPSCLNLQPGSSTHLLCGLGQRT